jgi:PST family polysaccharide transporter
MALRTALLWSGIQSILRLSLSFVSIKVTAVYLGAPGLAIIGQLGNFLTLIQGGVGNAIQTGVTKLTAESERDNERQRRVWRTGFRMALLLSMAAAVIVMSLAQPISAWLFDTHNYWPVIVLTGPCLVLGVMGLVFTGILNGLKRIRELALVTICASLVGAALFIPLAYRFGVWGGLIGTSLSAASTFFFGWFFLWRTHTSDMQSLRGHRDAGIVREIARFYPMLLANSAISPFALILVRNILSDGLDMHAAGYWQAAWRVSDMYTLMITTALSLYLMPHLSSARGEDSFASELFGITLKVVLLTAAAAVGIYVLRDVMIAVVFTREFVPVRDLLAWQLVGDVLKMASWPLRMALVIKLRARWYIALEAAAPLLHAGFTFVLLPHLQGNAATLGYALAYLITDLLLLVALRDYIAHWRQAKVQ